MFFEPCKNCGRKTFHRKLTMGMCQQCYMSWKQSEDEKVCRLENEARQWIENFSAHTKNAFQDGSLTRHHGTKKINSVYQDCIYILEHISEWKKYDLLENVLPEFFTEDEYSRSGLKCSLFPYRTFWSQNKIDLEKEFAELEEKTMNRKRESFNRSLDAYDYSFISRIAGVTFKNEDGRKRQTIIRKMGKGYKDNISSHIRLDRYLFEGEDAIAVLFDDSQIGNIPRDELPYLIANWDNLFRVDAYEVKGYDTLGVDLRIVFRGNEHKI